MSDVLRSIIRRVDAGWTWDDTPDGLAWFHFDRSTEPLTDVEAAAVHAATDGYEPRSDNDYTYEG